MVKAHCARSFLKSLDRLQVFENGALYSPKVLDIKDDELLASVSTALTRIAAASLELDYPTAVSAPHSIIKGFKNVLAVAVATDYDFPLAEKVGLALSQCPALMSR